MDEIYARLKVFVCRDVRVVGRRRDVVSEAEAVVAVLEVHIQETLVCSIKRYSPLSHGYHGIVVSQVWSQDHNSSVEEIRPSDIGGGGEVMGKIEQFVNSPVGNNVGIQIDDLSKLGLLPQVNFGECRVQIGSVH